MVIIITGIGIWICTTILIYNIKFNHKDRIRIMSCRQELKKYERLNKADKDSLF